MVVAEQIDDLNAYVLILYERLDGSGERIELQRALSFDEQDRTLGMDTYCVCVASGATHYGGVRSWDLSGNRLAFEFSVPAAAALGIEANLSVELPDSSEAIATVREGLLRIFAN